MKKLLFFLFAGALIFPTAGFSQPSPEPFPIGLDYYFPEGDHTFDPAVTQPKDVFGFELGEVHIDWGNALEYIYALAGSSDRISLKTFGRTNEYRPIVQLVITSPENQRNLESIRQERQKLADTGRSSSVDTDNMPVVVNLMAGMHGDELSGVNAVLAVAYYYTAAQGSAVEELLENTIITIVPGLNPDGINRFATWVKTTKSETNVSNTDSREFSEVWPVSRYNHYWANCNREWLLAQHPEGRTALAMFFEWYPNISIDHHEHSAENNFFFSPGNPDRTHHLIPQLNREFTGRVTSYMAKSFDKTGQLYISKELYDSYSYSMGSTYPAIFGAVGILLEQGSARGHLRATKTHGVRTFASTIRNHCLADMAAVQAGYEMRKELLDYQRDCFVDMRNRGAKDPVQGYVFNTRGSRGLAYNFIEHLRHHRIDIYKLARDVTHNGVVYSTEDSYIIPTDQDSYGILKAAMEKATEFRDSTFYDVSTWSFPYAYNLQYGELSRVGGLAGEKVTDNVFREGRLVGGQSGVAYVFGAGEYYSHKVINELHRNGLRMRVGEKPFTWDNDGAPITFSHGTALLQVAGQPLDADRIYELVGRLAKEAGVDIYSLNTGSMKEFDLGSSSFRFIEQPRVAVVVGQGVNASECGQIWMMLDKRFQAPPVLIEQTKFSGIDLNKYNVLIVAGGVPVFSTAVNEKIKKWVDAGNTLIATRGAYTWTNRAGLTDMKVKEAPVRSTPAYLPYEQREGAGAGNVVRGVIVGCRLDPTHPIGWGYSQDEIAVFRQGNTALEPSSDPYSMPLSYLDEPYISGCISQANLRHLAGSPAVMISPSGRGRVVYFSDDMNFRSYWYGTSKLFLNAIFFGQLM